MKLEHVLQLKGGDVFTISPQATVAELAAELADRNVGAMVVSTDGRSVEGVVSERDIVRSIVTQGASVLSQPVLSIMTSVVQCAPPTALTSDLMSLMTNSRIRHVPVLDEAQLLMGIVSIGDVVKSRLGELEHERDALVQYITLGG
ncbi:MAG: CBS domain-containing protein [Candidatus Nanopelagicales bacterium]|nr:CBS domain-containing protein [Candidatus Nanopelagicales bacterium]